jgi:tRNA-dihydrouridine synthase B
VKSLPGGEAFRAQMNLLDDGDAQLAAVGQFFESLGNSMDRIPADAMDAGEFTGATLSNNKNQERAAA